MKMAKRYKPEEVEARLQRDWQARGVYHFSPGDERPVYSIDTPPPTVSGNLHLGHVYSYTHADLMARFWRMRGCNLFYPMGYDDNGLPTERLVEKTLGVTASEIGRSAFIQKCLQVSEEAEKDYRALWERLGLSVDWRYSYRTIDDHARKTAQLSFLELYEKGLAYQQEAPVIWCPACRTAIAQAEVEDLARQSEFLHLAFGLEDGETLSIATTRPELLPSCVAVFVHPQDERYRPLVGKSAQVPLFGQRVPILEDTGADPEKGSGAVMCCTFGDSADVAWWRTHDLPFKMTIGRDGRMTESAGPYAGLKVEEARARIAADLEKEGLLLGREAVSQTLRAHERCGTPVEFLISAQWFIKTLEFKDELLEAGERLTWHPPHMKARYRSWVENLAWDWCISRQRYFGVPFPVWYCRDCGQVKLAREEQLPVDPADDQPSGNCECGGGSFTPETDVMDTWATSSHSPQLAGQWLEDEALFRQVYPMSLRPQAHEIIRTWAFYTILKALHHDMPLPWKELAISGWGIAAPGSEKLSKSRGGGPTSPLEMIESYSADAVRYWAASTGFGRDAVIDEDKIQAGARLVTKLWNVARFTSQFLEDGPPGEAIPPLTPADRWILAKAQALVARTTVLLESYEYAAAKGEVESFFWRDLADNYLEMAKQRLYDGAHPHHQGARFALRCALLTALKLLAPFLPYVTEEVYLKLFAGKADSSSIHTSRWPAVDARLADVRAAEDGEALVEIATAVRRYKSERGLSLASALPRLQLAVSDPRLKNLLAESQSDLMSVTRAEQIEIRDELEVRLKALQLDSGLAAAVEPAPSEG